MTPLAAALTWTAPPPPTAPPVAPSGSVRVFDAELPGLDPLHDTGPVDRRWQDLVFDRLFVRTEPPLSSAVVARAEVGPEAVTVQLAQGILFHDGQELGADDLCATVDYWSAGADPRGLAGCDELSDLSARIRFLAPVPDPLARLGFAVLPAGLSAEVLAVGGAFSRSPVGTGPMSASRVGRGFRLQAAVGSSRPASLSAIELGPSGDPLTDLRLLKTGGVDVVIDLPPATHAEARAAGCSVVGWPRAQGVPLAVVARPGFRVPAKRTAEAPFLDATGWKAP